MGLLLVGGVALRAEFCRLICARDDCATSADPATLSWRAWACRSRQSIPAGRHDFGVVDYSTIGPLRSWR
jgi:hypothetical protein